MPLALLAWLGQRTLSQSQIVATYQAKQLAESRLVEAQSLVHGFIEDLQQSSVATLSLLAFEGEPSENNIRAIRQAVGVDPYLEQIFVLDADRELLFPKDSALHSNSERIFARTIQALLADDKTFRAQTTSESVSVSPEKSKRAGRTSLVKFDRVRQVKKAIGNDENTELEALSSVGWTSWDTGTDTDIYLWHRRPNGALLGQKLSSAYWLAQLIARLPVSHSVEVEKTSLVEFSIRLISKRQQTVYQWGDYDIGAPQNPKPTAQQWLNYPLDGWRLEYFTPPKASNAINSIIFVLSFFSIALLVGIGGWLVWREYQRDIRTAEQRVNFVNQVSHELKTPLTNICIYADMLETEVDQDSEHNHDRVKKFATVVTSESKRLGRLINNVLNFSRSQQDKVTVHKQLASVNQVILSTLDHFAPAFNNKEIVVETDLADEPTLWLDAELLEQVLNNLLSNIEKYAADGKLAQISSTFEADTALITVSDAGLGVSKALQHKIFEPFERGTDSITEGVSGTGIGLSIARDLCRLHGGDLQLAESQQGASFVVRLNISEVSV